MFAPASRKALTRSPTAPAESSEPTLSNSRPDLSSASFLFERDAPKTRNSGPNSRTFRWVRNLANSPTNEVSGPTEAPFVMRDGSIHAGEGGCEVAQPCALKSASDGGSPNDIGHF